MYLQTYQLCIGYSPAAPVARDLELRLDAGELVALIGPNGAGKSTLLRTLAGLQAPLAGEITLDGQPMRELAAVAIARRRALVLTDRVETGGFTVRELVALGRQPHTGWFGGLRQADLDVVDRVIGQVGVQALAARPVAELSDGERQRVMIARALAQAPRLLLLDEPTAFLDLPHRVQILLLLRDLAHREGYAILLSTHDLDLAMRCVDRLWLMAGDGTLQAGSPEDLALDGALGRAFHADGLRVDAGSGGFALASAGGVDCQVVGTGDRAAWTRHALRRLGYVPVATAAALSVTVSASGWVLRSPAGEAVVGSIGELGVSLRRGRDAAASAPGPSSAPGN